MSDLNVQERHSTQLPITDAACLPPDEVLDHLGSSPAGLTNKEAAERLEQLGPNAVRTHRANGWAVLGRQFASPILILLIITAGASLFLGDATNSIVIGVILLVSVGLGFTNEFRAERASEALHSRVTHRAVVLRDGTTQDVDVTALVPGDVVHLSLGAIIPADIRLLSTKNLLCDESILTGESLPAGKDPGPVVHGSALCDLASYGSVRRRTAQPGYRCTTQFAPFHHSFFSVPPLILAGRPLVEGLSELGSDRCKQCAASTEERNALMATLDEAEMTLIEARGISKRYPGQATKAVNNASIKISRGEIIAVVGHNGAGKSTLFDILGGLTRPDQGKIELHVSSNEIGWCPQREIIDWSLTVRQNISIGLELRQRISRTKRREVIEEVAAAMGLADYLDRTAETLSGGELRRTQIARTMAGDPPLMVLDEPTTGLDPSGISEVFGYLERRMKEGAAALISTHETSRFSSHCTRVVAMHKGELIADLPVDEFMRAAPRSEDLWDGYMARAGA